MAGGDSRRAPIPSCCWFLQAAWVETQVLTRPLQFQGFVPSMGIDKFCLLGQETLLICPLVGFPMAFMVFSVLLRYPLPDSNSSDLPNMTSLRMPRPGSLEFVSKLDRISPFGSSIHSSLCVRLPLCHSKRLSTLVPEPPFQSSFYKKPIQTDAG